jgi:hypothetical protein
MIKRIFLPIWKVIIFAIINIYPIFIFIRDEFLSKEFKDSFQLVNLFKAIPWYYFTISGLVVWIIVAVIVSPNADIVTSFPVDKKSILNSIKQYLVTLMPEEKIVLSHILNNVNNIEILPTNLPGIQSLLYQGIILINDNITYKMGATIGHPFYLSTEAKKILKNKKTRATALEGFEKPLKQYFWQAN